MARIPKNLYKEGFLRTLSTVMTVTMAVKAFEPKTSKPARRDSEARGFCFPQRFLEKPESHLQRPRRLEESARIADFQVSFKWAMAFLCERGKNRSAPLKSEKGTSTQRNAPNIPHFGPHPLILYVGGPLLENKGAGAAPHKEFRATLGASSFLMWVFLYVGFSFPSHFLDLS